MKRNDIKTPKFAVDVSMSPDWLNNDQKKLMVKRNKTKPKEPRNHFTKKGALTKEYRRYMRLLRRWLKKYGLV